MLAFRTRSNGPIWSNMVQWWPRLRSGFSTKNTTCVAQAVTKQMERSSRNMFLKLFLKTLNLPKRGIYIYIIYYIYYIYKPPSLGEGRVRSTNWKTTETMGILGFEDVRSADIWLKWQLWAAVVNDFFFDVFGWRCQLCFEVLFVIWPHAHYHYPITLLVFRIEMIVPSG